MQEKKIKKSETSKKKKNIEVYSIMSSTNING